MLISWARWRYVLVEVTYYLLRWNYYHVSRRGRLRGCEMIRSQRRVLLKRSDEVNMERSVDDITKRLLLVALSNIVVRTAGSCQRGHVFE